MLIVGSNVITVGSSLLYSESIVVRWKLLLLFGQRGCFDGSLLNCVGSSEAWLLSCETSVHIEDRAS